MHIGGWIHHQAFLYGYTSIYHMFCFIGQLQTSSCYKPIKGYISGLTNRLQKGYESSGNSHLSCMSTPASWSHHPRRLIKAIISHHHTCFPHFGDLSFWFHLCYKSFEDKNYNLSELRILHLSITRFFCHFYFYLPFY